MSLTADGFALGAAFAIAVGSAVQARQAYTELNEKTPAGESFKTAGRGCDRGLAPRHDALVHGDDCSVHRPNARRDAPRAEPRAGR